MALQAVAIQLGIGLALWGGGKLVSWLSPSGRPVTKPPPKSLKLPRAGKGTIIPLVYGTTKIETPPIYWQGNEFVANDDDSPTTGAYRRIDLLLGAGIPPARNIVDWYVLEVPPRLMAIWIQGIRVPLAGGIGLAHGDSEQIDGDLGGRGAGGNYRVRVEFFDGRDGQDLATGTFYRRALDNANLGIPVDPNFVPGYARQMCVAIIMSPGALSPGLPLLEGVLGEGDSLVSIGLEVQALGTEAVLTDGSYYEANPAMVLLDLICGDVWKLGYPTSLVDTASFFDAAETLAEEGHGMSSSFATRGPSPHLLSELLDQVNGIIFNHHITGKLTMRLIRNEGGDLPVLNNSNTVGDPEVQFTGWQDLVNQVDVEFTDRSLNFVTNLATAQRGASAVGQGGQIRSRKISYPAITSAAVAAKQAARELGVAARPLMTATSRHLRSVVSVGYGDAVRADWVGPEGDVICNGKVFRVVGIDHGTIDEGEITLELIEDVFDASEGGLPPWPWGDDAPFDIPDEPEIGP